MPTRNEGASQQKRPINIPSVFQVVVQCHDECDQQVVYERMRKDGYRCRLLTLW